MEIKEKMWVSYCGRPYFITIIEGDLYIMLDVENEITNIKHKDLHKVKPIEVPVFYVDEKVLYTGDYNKDIKNQYVTITRITDNRYTRYVINGEYDVTPFELCRVAY